MPRGAVESYRTDLRVLLDKTELEHTVRSISEIEGLRLIRAAYNASLKDAQVIRAEILATK